MNQRAAKYKISIEVAPSSTIDYEVEHIEPKAGVTTKFQTRIHVYLKEKNIDIDVSMNKTISSCDVMERVMELHEFLATKWTSG